MKILLSAYACDPRYGGERSFGWNWAISLAKLKCHVLVLTQLSNKEAIDVEIKNQSLTHVDFFYIDIPKWSKLILIGPLGGYLSYFLWQWQAYKAAVELAKLHHFELVHHVTLSTIVGASWLWRLDKPFVFGPVGGGQIAPYSFRHYFFDKWCEEYFRSFVSRDLVRVNWLTKTTVRQANLILATNQESADLAYSLGGKNIQLFLDTGLPEDYVPTSLPNRAKPVSIQMKLLWVGKLIPRKGLRLALEMLARARELAPIELTIVGDGVLREKMFTWIHELDIEKIVKYKGQLPWLDLKSEYLENDVFLFTSLRDSFGSQLLEAMSLGLPIITLNHHGAAKFVPSDAGIKVNIDTPEVTLQELVNAVNYMFHQPQERSQMGERGYQFAKTQTWSKRAEKVFSFYNILLDGKDIDESQI